MAINVNSLVEILSKNKIHNIVFSLDAVDSDLYNAVKKNTAFTIYNCVDERNAAYFAMGACIECRNPVAVVCKSLLNAGNFFPAATESFYQNIPLLMLTEIEDSDNDLSVCDSFKSVTSQSVMLPENDNPRQNSLILQSTIASLNLRDKYPVFVAYKSGKCESDSRKVNLIDYSNQTEDAISLLKQLGNSQNVLLVGDDYSDGILIREFINKFKCKHVYGDETLRTLRNDNYDLVITIEEKDICEINPKTHWHISAKPNYWDPFGRLENIWLHTPADFLNFCIANSKVDSIESNYQTENNITQGSYKYETEIQSQVQAIINTMNPGIIQLSSRYFTEELKNLELQEETKVYRNSSLLSGGAISTFLGSSFSTNEEALLIIDDVVFFKDINSLMTRNVSGNLHILILDNGKSGSVSYIRNNKNNEYLKYEETVKSAGFEYYNADSIMDITNCLKEFCKKKYLPSLLRVSI